MSHEFRYRAFISYSHSDERWAEWLHRALETYRLPRHLVGRDTEFGPVPERLVPVFRDREELATATNLGETLTRALAESATQIVICSPAAARSRWVNEEILTFKRLGREDRIFCLIVAGEPGASARPGTTDEECFPNALIFHMGADGELTGERSEPIAADVRPGKDGRSVHQILSNYQAGVAPKRPWMGGGFIRLMQFLPDRRTIRVRSYSPWSDQFLTTPDQQFEIRL